MAEHMQLKYFQCTKNIQNIANKLLHIKIHNKFTKFVHTTTYLTKGR